MVVPTLNFTDLSDCVEESCACCWAWSRVRAGSSAASWIWRDCIVGHYDLFSSDTSEVYDDICTFTWSNEQCSLQELVCLVSLRLPPITQICTPGILRLKKRAFAPSTIRKRYLRGSTFRYGHDLPFTRIMSPKNSGIQNGWTLGFGGPPLNPAPSVG